MLLAPQAAEAAPAGGGVVRGLAFPGDAGFAYAGCEDPDGGAQPHAVVRKIPGSPGGRSTGFATEAGTGAGPQTAVSSLRGMGDMSIKVWSEGGSAGFAYVWLFPTSGDTAYLGRTPLRTGGGWDTSNVSGRTFTWTERDATSFAAVEGLGASGTKTLRSAAAAFGNGPARVGFGFGCDGEDFSLDSFRAGGRSYDFDGIEVATSMTVTRSGRAVTLVGRSLGGGVNRGEPLVLQRMKQGRWTAVDPALVEVDEAGVHTAVLRPAATSRFRWSRREVSYAEAGVSRIAIVPATGKPTLEKKRGKDADRRGGQRVAPEDPTTPPAPEPTDPPTTEPTEPATPDPTAPPTEDPTAPPSDEPTEPTEPAVPDPTTPPSAEPTPEPSPEPTPEAPVFCEGMTYDDTALWLESEGLEASDIESSIDEDCPTAEELEELAPLLGLELDLDGTPED